MVSLGVTTNIFHECQFATSASVSQEGKHFSRSNHNGWWKLYSWSKSDVYGMEIFHFASKEKVQGHFLCRESCVDRVLGFQRSCSCRLSQTTRNSKHWLLQRLKSAIHHKRREFLTQGVFLHDDNARPHTANQSQLARFCWECLEQPPYIPHLVPSDFHLFPALKKELEGRSFQDDGQVKTAMWCFYTARAIGSLKMAFRSWFTDGTNASTSKVK